MDIKDYIIFHTTGNVYWKDKEGRYLGCNLAFAKISHLEHPENIIGKTDRDLFLNSLGEEGIKKLVDVDKKVIYENVEMVIEEVGIDEEGKKAFYFTKKIPLKNEIGEIIGLVGTSIDVTKQKASEAAKTEFMTNMSHDLRTPLTAALAIINSLVSSCKEVLTALQNSASLAETEKTKLLKDLATIGQDYGNIAQSAIQEVSDLFDEILEIIRVKSGQAKTESESFNLQNLVDRTLALLKPVALERQLTLSAEIDAEVPPYLTGLAHYLTRTLLNLMGNGLKFTEKGSVLVRARLSEQLEQPLLPGDLVTLIVTVEDTGIGIPQEKFETIFENFSRLTPSYQGIYKGAGLGLYSIKQYVAAMKGQITVTSKVGEGSCFTLTVPMTVAREEEAVKVKGGGVQEVPCEEQRSIQKEPTSVPLMAEKAHREETPRSKGAVGREVKAPIRVLLVEDNSMVALATATSLKQLGWAVDVARDGETAVEKAQQAHYDMIFMDIGLPKMDGIETTASIRALPNSEYAQVPIVAVTGHGREDHYQACMAAGMNEVYRKPLPPALFEEAMQRFARKPEEVKKFKELLVPTQNLDPL